MTDMARYKCPLLLLHYLFHSSVVNGIHSVVTFNIVTSHWQVHAARTGHQSFSESTEEIKPLSEEEKKEQLAR